MTVVPSDAAGAQSVKEAAGGSTAGVVMMTSDDASSSRDGGLGLGGGSADKNGGGHLADLGAVLKKETIDASVDPAGYPAVMDLSRGQAGRRSVPGISREFNVGRR